MFACIYRPPSDRRTTPSPPGAVRFLGEFGGLPPPLVEVAEQFSPRYERHRDDLISIDVSGLDRLFGDAATIASELRRTARTHQLHVHVAIAGTRAAAVILAQARPGTTVVERGNEAASLAPLPIAILERAAADHDRTHGSQSTQRESRGSASSVCSVLKTWGIRTLGELAALPPADLSARLGQDGVAWQALARGEDARPLVPAIPEERFESTLELEWPIEGLEPLSFVLTRLIEPLLVRLERRDRGAAAIATSLRLVSRETCARRLELPTPLRDLRALRTLVLLDLDAHPPDAAIDVVTVAIEPTPGRIVQHALFTRPTPTPEQLSTLVARLDALMGQDRVGSPVVVDSYRPGAFAMKPFAMEHDVERRIRRTRRKEEVDSANSASSALNVLPGVLRRCRQPVPARVAVEDGRPVRVTTDRRGYGGGRVVRAAGPWRVSGEWWEPGAYRRDEWDVELAGGIVYRVFRDEFSERWFIDAVHD